MSEQSIQDIEQNESESMVVRLSDDEMTASLFLPESLDVLTVQSDRILALLRENGIKFGVLDHILQNIVDQPDQFLGQEITIARGQEPIHGEDAKLESVYQMKNKKRIEEKEDGTIDFFTITEIANVEKGQILAKKLPPTEGEDGWTVKKQRVQAKHGRDMKVKLGKNVVYNQDHHAIYAAIDGQVSETDRINVYPVFEVNSDLDLSVGNIDFVGNVVIRGSVPSGYKIKAKGDIRITGGVEGAFIEADGSIHIQSGVTAQHNGFLKAGQDVHTTFIVNGNVEAKGSISVSQTIMHSNVRAGQSIECRGDKGLIVGGHVQAGRSLFCRTLGNTMNTTTVVEVGQDPYLANQIKALDQQLFSLSETQTKTDQALQVIDQMFQKQGKLSVDKRELRMKLTNTKLETEKQVRRIQETRKELQEKLEQSDDVKVEISAVIYPGTKLDLGKYSKLIKEPHQRMRFKLQDHQIVTEPLT